MRLTAFAAAAALVATVALLGLRGAWRGASQGVPQAAGGSSPVTASLAGATAESDEPPDVDALIAQRTAEAKEVSRSTSRTARVTTLRALDQPSGRQVTRAQRLASGDPRDVARALLPEFGFGADQFDCLDALWTRESGWSHTAANPSSGAYGIPQALPGSKMASAGADWETNPATQIRWGLGYIQARYGTPCGAWDHSESSGWY